MLPPPPFFWLAALQSFRAAVQPVPFFTKALYACLGDLPELWPKSGWRDFQATLTLTAAAWAELEFWRERLREWNGTPAAAQRATRVLYTDASGGGWGALLARAQQRGYDAAVYRMSSTWDEIDSVSPDVAAGLLVADLLHRLLAVLCSRVSAGCVQHGRDARGGRCSASSQ